MQGFANFLDAYVEEYKQRLDENGPVAFKGKAKAFVRSYGFLAAIQQVMTCFLADCYHALPAR